MNDFLNSNTDTRPSHEQPSGEWPRGHGEMAGRVRCHAWASSVLGPLESWPENLRCAVQLTLDSMEPTCLLWTTAGIHIYNDAYRDILNARHPNALGGTFVRVWPEFAHSGIHHYAEVLRTGLAEVEVNRPYFAVEPDSSRERYFTVFSTPIRGRNGSIDGVLQTLIETTEHVESQRRLRYTVAQLGEQQAAVTLRLALSDAISEDFGRQREQARSELQDREERLRLAVIAGRLATWDWNVPSGQVIWSDQMYPMHGYSPDEVEPSFGAWAQRVHPDDLPSLLTDLERARNQQSEFSHRFRIVHPDRSVHWCAARGRYFYDAAGNALRMLAVAQDITDEHRAQLKLRDIEMRQRALIEGLPQLIWRADSLGRWTWCSPQWERYSGLSFADSLYDGWLSAVHPQDRQRVREAWSDAAAAGVFDIEYRIGTAGTDRYRWFQTRATPIRNEEQGVSEWLGTSTDIDELRQARERQQLLVAELQHRTRNLIGVVKALATMTARGCSDVRTFQASFGERLEALSRSQELLSRSEEEPITLERLLRMELEALGQIDWEDRVRIEGPPVRMQKAVVQTFALAIHELATNALKHGALRTAAGSIAITWRLLTDSTGAHRLRLQWQEVTEVNAPTSLRTNNRGYGRELLEEMLPYVLDAKTRYEITSAGARCTIELPVSLDNSEGAVKIVAAQ